MRRNEKRQRVAFIVATSGAVILTLSIGVGHALSDSWPTYRGTGICADGDNSDFTVVDDVACAVGSEHPMDSDYLGLLTAIITAFGLILAALIRRDGDEKREADQRDHEKNIARILAAKNQETENDNGSGYSWVILTVIILGLVIFFDMDSY